MKLVLILMIVSLLVLACQPVPNKDWESGLYDSKEDMPAVISKRNTQPFCGDGACQANESKCGCPKDCGVCAGNVSSTTHWACVKDVCEITRIPGICGNTICEAGEYGVCDEDCVSCDDRDVCTKDSLDLKSQSCLHERVSPCCGDAICQASEELSCLADCGSSVDLGDYPEPFVANNRFQAHLVVGSKGDYQSELVIAGISIMNGLSYNETAPSYSTTGKLDTEIASIQDRNVILVGSPCQNEFVKELMPYMYVCDEALPPTGALIRLFKTGTKTYALAVMGKTGSDVRRAGRYLEMRREMSGFEARP